jgi:alcohol dehydrogenase, propanol-preferring
MRMRAARMHGYNQLLRIDDVQVPEVGSTQVLIKVAATGMCRSDFQLVDGYFRQGLPVDLPFIPGHEVAGTITGVGKEVPTSSGLSEGDLIVVDPNWVTAPAGNVTKAMNNSVAVDSSSGLGPTAVSRSTWLRRTITSSPSPIYPINGPSI